jgi:hypothetical protein
MGASGVFGSEPFAIFEALAETHEEALMNFELARSRREWAARNGNSSGAI